MGANGFAAVVGGSQAEVLAETVAEVGAVAETAIGGNLHDGLVGLFQELLGGIVQTQLQDVGAHLAIFAAFGEDAAYAFL